MSTFRSTLGSMLIAALMALVPPATAQTYNLAQNWSATDNPNGAWSYRRGTTLLPFQSTTCCGLPVTTSFAPSSVSGSFLPVFYRPGNAGTDFLVHSYDPFNGGTFIGEATLVWTAPSAGIANLSGYFYYAQLPEQRSDDIVIRRASTIIATQTVSSGSFFDSSHPWNFSFSNLAVNAGDTISFTFQRTTGFSAGSAVGGNAVITLVPELAPAAMLGLGLGALFLWRSAKRGSGRSR